MCSLRYLDFIASFCVFLILCIHETYICVVFNCAIGKMQIVCILCFKFCSLSFSLIKGILCVFGGFFFFYPSEACHMAA